MEIIEKQDFRTVSPEVRVAIRKRGMPMIEKGKRKGEVAKLLGVNKNTVSNWCKAYKANGMEGLSDKKRGTKSEDRKLLTDGQEIEIQELITDKYPEQYGLAFALWTRKSVKELIAEKHGVVLAIRTMGKYLKRWGFTPQKPKKKAYEQNSVKVQKWHEEEYPRLKKRAKEENAEIHWGDETGCKNQSNHGRSYAPKGKTPVKGSMSKQFKINMISTITNQGKVHFMIYSDSMNADRLMDFLKQLIKTGERKIFLVLDNLKVHHSHIVREWVKSEEVKRKLEIFWLPSYSPELNPDEYLNCDLKHGLSHKPAPKSVKELRENVENHMTMLQQTPSRIAKYFKHESIKYAA